MVVDTLIDLLDLDDLVAGACYNYLIGCSRQTHITAHFLVFTAVLMIKDLDSRCRLEVVILKA